MRSEAIRAGKIVRNLLAFVRRSSSERTIASINDIVKSGIIESQLVVPQFVLGELVAQAIELDPLLPVHRLGWQSERSHCWGGDGSLLFPR